MKNKHLHREKMAHSLDLFVQKSKGGEINENEATSSKGSKITTAPSVLMELIYLIK